MSKFFALYHNEFIKITKKKSIIVLTLIMIALVVGVGTVMKLTDTYVVEKTTDEVWQMENMATELESFKKQYESLKSQLDGETNKDQISYLKNEIQNLESNIYIYEIAIEKGISLYNDDYLSSALNQIFSLKNGQFNFDEKKANSLISLYEESITEKSYKKYLDADNLFAELRENYAKDELKYYVEGNSLKLKSNPEGQANPELDNLINTIVDNNISLHRNVSYYDNLPLTLDERDDLTNENAINLYKVENNIINKEETAGKYSVSTMNMVGMTIIVLMMIILAGGSISQEISSGSIKSLIIAPVKRWKIFAAKLASIISTGLIIMLILYVFSLLVNLIYFGTGNMQPYIHATNGVANEISFPVFTLLKMLVNFIDVFVYIIFAFMLSIVTRNTAASVGISMAAYFGGNTLIAIANALFSGEWLKFIPFNNFSLESKFFPDLKDDVSMIFGGSAINISLNFSIIYLSVLSICILLTAFDSFTRKDI